MENDQQEDAPHVAPSSSTLTTHAGLVREEAEAATWPQGVPLSSEALRSPHPEHKSLGDSADAEASISILLRILRAHHDKRTAVTAALKAVMTLPLGATEVPAVLPSDTPPLTGTATPLTDLPSPTAASQGSGQAAERLRGRSEVLPDPNTFLEAFPRCKQLVETFRSTPNTHNKSPLAILHEYATRLSLELAYNETADSNLGPFTVEAKLTSTGGEVLYATGAGRGRGKKDAKQVAAAALLEMLLVNVPEADFLQPGKLKVAKAQGTSYMAQQAALRGGLGNPIRGRAPGGMIAPGGPGRVGAARWAPGRTGGRQGGFTPGGQDPYGPIGYNSYGGPAPNQLGGPRNYLPQQRGGGLGGGYPADPAFYSKAGGERHFGGMPDALLEQGLIEQLPQLGVEQFRYQLEGSSNGAYQQQQAVYSNAQELTHYASQQYVGNPQGLAVGQGYHDALAYTAHRALSDPGSEIYGGVVPQGPAPYTRHP